MMKTQFLNSEGFKITLDGASKSQKKDRGNSKICFTHKDQSGLLNFELSYNERTLDKIPS